MYLALFLSPWILMYALSTLAMNHRAAFNARYGPGPAAFETERELVYDGSFAENAELRTISQQILQSVGLDGAHGVTRRKDGAIVITRNDLLTPRRLTYVPADRRLLIEKMPHRPNAFLERFHRQEGLCHRLPARHRVGGLGRSRHRRDGVLGGLRPLDVVGDDGHPQVRRVGPSWRRGSVCPLPSVALTGRSMTFSHFNRRLHLYLGLALLPWFFMYAISSVPFAHNQFFEQRDAARGLPLWTLRSRAHGRSPRSGGPRGAAAPRCGAPRDRRNRRAPASAPTGRVRLRSTCTPIRSGHRHS